MPVKYSVRITESSEQDIEDIWRYISEDSPERATDFILRIESKVKDLEQYPNRCPVIPESDFLGIEYRHQVIGKYRIIFRVEKQTVYIMRVIHSSRLLNL